MDLCQEQLEELFWDILPEGVDMEEGPDWTDGGKYQQGAVVFKMGNKYYKMEASRSGSYHSDYYYSWEDTPLVPYEVTPETETTIRWVKAGMTK